MDNEFTGLLLDQRTTEDKEFDYSHDELNILAGASIPYLTKAEATKAIGKYPVENQGSTSSCVAHSTALILGIENSLEGQGYVRLAPAFIYALRMNYPDAGMYQIDAAKIASKLGCPLFQTLPTPYSENDINKLTDHITGEMRIEATKYRAKNYTTIPAYNIDKIAEIVNGLHKPVGILTYFSRDEWSSDYPTIKHDYSLNNAPLMHQITVLPDSAYMDNGKAYFIIQDSAPFGGISFRHISEDWVAKRVFSAVYTLNLSNDIAIQKPKYQFKTDLSYGQTSDDVKHLQECLGYLGYFPTSIQTSPLSIISSTVQMMTGYYGGITKNAVKKFQEDNADEVLKPSNLTAGTGYCGANTRALLNKLFS